MATSRARNQVLGMREEYSTEMAGLGGEVMNWHEWLKENLRPDQYECLDAYDVQILVSLNKRVKRSKIQQRYALPSPMVMGEVGAIWRDVHGEMGGITEEQIYERLKKLSDMALTRVYATFNRDMPEDL